MTALPSISVVIPVYNVEEYISECLFSVIRQTYKGAVECIIVDDCGTDKSIALAREIIQSQTSAITFQIIRHTRNRGLSAARNTGTEAARGEYIYYLDSDDYLPETCLEQLASPLLAQRYDMVIGRVMGSNQKTDENPYVIQGNEAVFRTYYVDKKIYPTAWNRLFRKDLFVRYDWSFPEGLLQEDEFWNYKVFTTLTNLVLMPQETYFYRVRPNSIITTVSKNLSGHVESTCQTACYVLQHPWHVNERYYAQCLRFYMSNFFHYAALVSGGYYAYYLSLREMTDYAPFTLWRQGQIALSDVMHHLHFALSPRVGYTFLRLKRKGKV